VLQNSLLFSFFFQSQVVEFAWTSIKEWEVDDEAMAFCFQYQRPEKNPRWVKIFTPYVSLFSYDQPHCSCTYFYVCYLACNCIQILFSRLCGFVWNIFESHWMYSLFGLSWQWRQ